MLMTISAVWAHGRESGRRTTANSFSINKIKRALFSPDRCSFKFLSEQLLLSIEGHPLGSGSPDLHPMEVANMVQAAVVVKDEGDVRISDLPSCLIENILCRIPLREAVQTSMLSRFWRYRWSQMGCLVFTDPLVHPLLPLSSVRELMVQFVTTALLLHHGPINIFEMTSNLLNSRPEVVQQCILFLSRNGVQEFVLKFMDGQIFRLPSSLFDCEYLTRMELQRCTFNLPLASRGFSLLTKLSLTNFEVDTNALESLIASCPVLDSLSLSHFDNVSPRIYAPNLKFLSIELEGYPREIVLDRTLLLASINFVISITTDILEHRLEEDPMIKFLGGKPKIQTLTGRIHFHKLLDLDDDNPQALRVTVAPLKVMEFHRVSFADKNEILAAIRFIKNFPDLEEIVISESYNPLALHATDLDFWEEESPSNCKFDNLKTAKLLNASGVPHELAFIKLLMGKAPKLEKLIMLPSAQVVGGKISLLKKVNLFHRASLGVVIELIM